MIMCIKFVFKKLLQISKFWTINVQLVDKTTLLKHRPWDLNSKTRLRTIFPCNSATYPCTGLFMGSCHVWASHGRVSGPNHTHMLHFSQVFPVLMSFYS